MSKNIIRLNAEKLYEKELETLFNKDKNLEKPAGWKLTPKSVYTFIVGGNIDGVDISPKYFGNNRAVEIAIATLITDRALLLIGAPGTAKTWLSELLAAAISFDSSKCIQGTAGTSEQQIKYSWNYAMLLSDGPSKESLIKSPVVKAMGLGEILRFEEITRCNPEIQDSLISILSEKVVSIPELNDTIHAKSGFNIIATANTHDQGVSEMSSALKRRFNTVVLKTPDDIETEIDIVVKRIRENSSSYLLNASIPKRNEIKKILTIFRELREGQTLDGEKKVNKPSGVLSTAEAISLISNSMSLAASFGDGEVKSKDLASGIVGVVVKNEETDKKLWEQYIDNVLKDRKGFEDLYLESKNLL